MCVYVLYITVSVCICPIYHCECVQEDTCVCVLGLPWMSVCIWCQAKWYKTIFIYIYIYIHMYICTHTQARTYMYTYKHRHAHILPDTQLWNVKYTIDHIKKTIRYTHCQAKCVYVCVYMYTYQYVPACAYIRIYIHIHLDPKISGQ